MEITNQSTPTNKSISTKRIELVLLITIPLLLVLSLTFLFAINQQRKSRQYKEEKVKETVQKSEKEKEEQEKQKEEAARLNVADTLVKIPQNPTQVTVTCKSTGEQITSGQVTNCSDPVFTWSGEKARGKGVEIQGYYVYFGENNQPFIWPDHKGQEENKIDPWVHGNYQSSNEFQPGETFLQKGKTYYLMVQAVSTSKNPVHQTGRIILDQTGQRVQAAEVLFEYKYQ